ncbi:MAG TPA: hypothetical protein VMI72_10875 [Roseiarcus sp.]|nr:hypothetical protein [Roseiarcus sp.]
MADLHYEYLGQRFRPREESEQQLLLFVAPARDIRSWAGVPRKAFDYQHGFQRTLNQSRVSEISQYFREDTKNISPTSIVVGFTGAVTVEAAGPEVQDGVEPIKVRIMLPNLTQLPLNELGACRAA